jgi:hypothetical protein
MKSFNRLTVLVLVFLLCAAPTIYFDVMVPAAIDLPGHIRSLAIIDRSHSENKVVTLVEKGLYSAITGEKDPLSVTCINGLSDQLRNYQAIQLVHTPVVEKRPGTSMEFPEPLHWFEVDAYCKQFGTDALISMEIFTIQLLKDAAEVKVGFRIYDPASKQVIDQFMFFNSAGLRNPTPNLEGMVMKLVNEDGAMYDASYGAGVIYGKRITPAWYRAERKYYKRSKRNDDFAMGARMMEINDWNAAIESLEAAYQSPKRKTRGRAAHNLAVVYEILGDLPAAKEWAQVAWGKHRNKHSKEYVMILNRRMQDVAIIQQQEAR